MFEDKEEPIIMEINLKNYPGILNHPEAARMLQSHLKLLSDALDANHHVTSEEVFKTDYVSILGDITDAMFNYKSLLKHHPNKAEAEAMEILEHENNPLSIFTGYSTPFDFKGNRMKPSDFLGPYPNFRKWFQAQLYASRYLPYKDYVNYMYLTDFDMLESLKHANVEKLIQVQPALKYQKEHDLPIGKFLEGTGFFDCGTSNEPFCLACQSTNIWDTEENVYCLDCKGGFKK